MAKTQEVVRANQSPMNAKRWLVELPCGHEEWVTSTRRPKKAACSTCEAKR